MGMSPRIATPPYPPTRNIILLLRVELQVLNLSNLQTAIYFAMISMLSKTIQVRYRFFSSCALK